MEVGQRRKPKMDARLIYRLSRGVALTLVATAMVLITPLPAQATTEPLTKAVPVFMTGQGAKHRITAKPEPARLPVSELHNWVVTIHDLAGTPVQPKAIHVSGGMPAHAHGLPSQPTVSHYLGDGAWLLSDVYFNMPGHWQLAFRLVGAQGNDDVVLNFQVDVASTPASSISDSNWTVSQLNLLASLRLSSLPEPKNTTGNQVANNPDAAAFGEELFFDENLSADNTRSCGSCHQRDNYFVDGQKTARGAKPLQRNTPSLLDSAFQDWFYWDGRRDSLWSQALVPLEAVDELGSTRIGVLKYIAGVEQYASTYKELFGPLPRLDGLAQHATPMGDTRAQQAWQEIFAPRRIEISTAFANIGKAIAAYERTLRSQPARFDRFVNALLNDDADQADALLTVQEQRGLKLFIDGNSQCLNCHNGPLMTNRGFHNIGTGRFDGDSPDFGRMLGLQAMFLDEFNCSGAYTNSEIGSADCAHLEAAKRTEIESMLQGSYKVPSLRNVEHTAPYMHDGRYATLVDAIEHYRKPPEGFHELAGLESLSDKDAEDLVAFLNTLSSSSNATATMQR